MVKKVIPKALLDKAIELDREYWTGSASLFVLEREIDVCEQIDSLVGVSWVSLGQLLSAVFPQRGLKHDATNEEIYSVLRVLGWDVSE